MFVSSYNSYVQTDSSLKSSRTKLDKLNSVSDIFSKKLAQKNFTDSFNASSIPSQYISKNLAHTNKQELDFQKEQLKNPQNEVTKEIKETLTKFAVNNSLTNAKNAYEHTTKIYTPYTKQSISLNQTPKMDKNLPEEAYEAKEFHMRHTMIHTYISNDRYYQVTA